MITRLRRWIASRVFGRCPATGKRHRWQVDDLVRESEIPPHFCGDYCSHYLVRCADCDDIDINGSHTDEVR